MYNVTGMPYSSSRSEAPKSSSLSWTNSLLFGVDFLLVAACLACLGAGPFSSLVPMFLHFRPASEHFFHGFLTLSPAAWQVLRSALKAPHSLFDIFFQRHSPLFSASRSLRISPIVPMFDELVKVTLVGHPSNFTPYISTMAVL